MKLFLNLILYFVPFVLGSFINNHEVNIASLYNAENITINNYQNLSYHNSVSLHVLEIIDNKNICVVTCGLDKLTNEILDVCNHFNVDISVENF